MKFPAFLFCFLLSTVSLLCQAGETITVDGQTYRNCELVELSFDGVIYKSGDTGSFHVVPWPQLSPIQQNLIRTQHNDALVNAICDARYIKGTVFHANKDGVVVQISLSADGETAGTEGFKNGAKVVTSGLVLISDLPLDVPRSTGDPIDLIAYYKEKTKFDMVIAAQEIEHLTTAKPDWFQITDWTNSGGQTMRAKFLGMKDDKVLFLKEDGQRFIYSFSQLNTESQAKAKQIHERLSKFPVP